MLLDLATAVFRKAFGLQVKWYRELTIQTKPLNYILKYYTLFRLRVTQFSVSASSKVLWSKNIFDIGIAKQIYVDPRETGDDSYIGRTHLMHGCLDTKRKVQIKLVVPSVLKVQTNKSRECVLHHSLHGFVVHC